MSASEAGRLNPAELKIDLLCRGARVPERGELAERARPIARTRAGLGSGLELVLPGHSRDLSVNVPVEESFAWASPYLLDAAGPEPALVDERCGALYPVRFAPLPPWYMRSTRRGVPMSRIATLQGTCLSIYLGERCHFWKGRDSLQCAFCTTGLNVGTAEEETKTIADVVETALAARDESGVSFIHLNGGFQGAGALARSLPYLEALKKRVGALVGLQFTPEKDLSLYDEALRLGADHFSFCFELFNADYFRHLLPGKNRVFGREPFFAALEYCARRMGRGRVSGEIIAGIEPVEDTLAAIEYIVRVGAFPFVCVFRPLVGSDLQERRPPEFADMLRVYTHVYRTCRRARLPVGMAPNINVSLSLPPEDTLYLAGRRPADWLYLRWLAGLKLVLRPYFARRMRPSAPQQRGDPAYAAEARRQI